jgi:exodeoxyribonuclease VII small subunit
MSKQKIPLHFEAALKELTTIVELLEHGEGQLDLETSLKNFERGIELTRVCQNALADAKQKVEILVSKNQGSTLIDFNEENSSTS